MQKLAHVPCQHNHPAWRGYLTILNLPPVNVFSNITKYPPWRRFTALGWLLVHTTYLHARPPLAFLWASEQCFTADICVEKRDKQRRQQERVVTEACILQHLANVFNYLHVTLNHTADICFSLINWFHYSDCLSKNSFHGAEIHFLLVFRGSIYIGTP